MVEHPTADRDVPGSNPGAPNLDSGAYCMLIKLFVTEDEYLEGKGNLHLFDVISVQMICNFSVYSGILKLF